MYNCSPQRNVIDNKWTEAVQWRVEGYTSLALMVELMQLFMVETERFKQSINIIKRSVYIQMENKSREKKGSKVPMPHKITVKPLAKETDPTFPPIKSLKKDNSIDQKAIMNRPPTNTRLSQKKIQTVKRPPTSTKLVAQKQKPSKEKPSWSRLPLNLLLDIAALCCSSPIQVYQLSLICSVWRQYMSCENAIYFWKRFPQTERAKSFPQFKLCLQQQLQSLKQKMSMQFETMFTKLFNYGSTKQNIPNKLINRLKLELEVVINKKRYPVYPFKLRNFNFSSYLFTKINELQLIQFDLYTPHNFFKDNLDVVLTFYSRTFKVSHSLHYSFQPEEIGDCAIRQKAFNYFLAKNLIITFFEGDTNFLYCYLEISALELINEFRKQIRANFAQHIAKQSKKIPLYKQLCQTTFDDFVQYVKFQADFELHMSYHNSKQQIFTHCDTKVFPREYDQKMAFFEVKIDDTFEKTSTFLLDNKMGMSEQIDDLYLLDFVLKDRDQFLIVFSGFIYARKATQKERESVDNYFQFAQLTVKILEFKKEKYDLNIMIIEEKKKNLIKYARFFLYP